MRQHVMVTTIMNSTFEKVGASTVLDIGGRKVRGRQVRKDKNKRQVRKDKRQRQRQKTEEKSTYMYFPVSLGGGRY